MAPGRHAIPEIRISAAVFRFHGAQADRRTVGPSQALGCCTGAAPGPVAAIGTRWRVRNDLKCTKKKFASRFGHQGLGHQGLGMAPDNSVHC
jgi:hypothetical protein